MLSVLPRPILLLLACLGLVTILASWCFSLFYPLLLLLLLLLLLRLVLWSRPCVSGWPASGDGLGAYFAEGMSC